MTDGIGASFTPSARLSPYYATPPSPRQARHKSYRAAPAIPAPGKKTSLGLVGLGKAQACIRDDSLRLQVRGLVGTAASTIPATAGGFAKLHTHVTRAEAYTIILDATRKFVNESNKRLHEASGSDGASNMTAEDRELIDALSHSLQTCDYAQHAMADSEAKLLSLLAPEQQMVAKVSLSESDPLRALACYLWPPCFCHTRWMRAHKGVVRPGLAQVVAD